MVRLSEDLRAYLASSDTPRQVLVTLKPKLHPELVLRGKRGVVASYRRAGESNRAHVISMLQEERAHNKQVRFNPLGVLDQIALIAPRGVIERLARHEDVAAIVPDEPTDVLGDNDL